MGSKLTLLGIPACDFKLHTQMEKYLMRLSNFNQKPFLFGDKKNFSVLELFILAFKADQISFPKI